MSQPNRQPKRARVKRGENQGDFLCNTCSRSYFSYPALYTHVKTKHGIEAMQNIQKPKTEGKRGRPSREETNVNQQQNRQAPPLSLKIMIESKQCSDEMLYDLYQLDLQQILMNEADLRDNALILEALMEVGRLHREDVRDLHQTFQNILETEQSDELTIRDDLVVVTIDEAICQFWSDISLSIKIPFLKHIFFLLLVYRKYLNESPQNHRIQNFTRTQSPSQIWREAPHEVIQQHVPQALANRSLIQQLAAEEDNLFLLNEGKVNQIVQLVIYYFTNWMYFRRYSTQKISIT